MTKEFKNKFEEIVKRPVSDQLEFFLKRYIFVLGDDWKKVTELATKFKSYTESRNDNYDLNHTEAADFLQKNGKTRTAQERKDELKDIDLDNNGRIAFLEYLLLHFKVLILTEFFEKKGKAIPSTIDLSKDGVGVTGVGEYILEALFTFGTDIDPEIEKAIEQVTKENREREEKMEVLKKIINDASKSQVDQMKAKHELLKIEKEDTSGADVALITLMAGRRRVQREARNAKEKNEKALNESKLHEEEEKQKKLLESKSRLNDMKTKFESSAKATSDKAVKKKDI